MQKVYTLESGEEAKGLNEEVTKSGPHQFQTIKRDDIVQRILQSEKSAKRGEGQC